MTEVTGSNQPLVCAHSRSYMGNPTVPGVPGVPGVPEAPEVPGRTQAAIPRE